MSSLQYNARRMARLRRIPGFLAWNRLFFKRDYPLLKREFFGLSFLHLLGVGPVMDRQAELLDACSSLGYAFSSILPGDTPINEIANRLSHRKTSILAAIELKTDGISEEQMKSRLIRTYSLLYDFTDFFIVDISRQSGLDSLDDISDWSDILDELLKLRLYYEKYRPILLRLPSDHTKEQMVSDLDFCLMSGIDGVIAPGIEMVRFAAEHTKGRLPIIGSGDISSPSDAAALLQAGAGLIEITKGLPGHCRTTARRILQFLEPPASL